MKVIIILFLSFMIISCPAEVKFPAIEELGTQLKQTECYYLYVKAAFTNHKEFFGIRQEFIDEYKKLLTEEADIPLVLVETVVQPEFNRSVFSSVFVTGKKIYYHAAIREKSEKSIKMTL